MKLEVYLEKCCTAIVVQQNAVEDFYRKSCSFCSFVEKKKKQCIFVFEGSCRCRSGICIICIIIGGSKEGDTPGSNFFIFMEFLGEIGKNIRLAPPPLGNPGSATDYVLGSAVNRERKITKYVLKVWVQIYMFKLFM